MKPSLKEMAKEAKTKKFAAPKKAVKEALPPTNLSTEFVQESDIEEEEDSDQASSSDDEEELPEKPTVVKSKTNGNPVIPPADSTSSSDSESAEDNESEDGDEEDSETSHSAQKPAKSSSISSQ